MTRPHVAGSPEVCDLPPVRATSVDRLPKVQPTQFGKYILLDRIGMGGMAEIFRARALGAAGFQKQLVIKKILMHLAENDEFVRMFIDEAKIAVSLQHANVVQIFDLGAVRQEYFIAMEYVFGKDLLNLLIRCTHLRIRIPQKLAVFILCETLKGLEAAHNAVDSRGNPLNIIHRDVSPSNVLISYDGEVKIGDFGVAKATRREAATKTGTMKGKLGYMSPEQVTGQEIDARADLFSAGIILYEMLAMNRLFHGKTELETLMMVRDCDVADAVGKLPPDVPEPLRRILLKALSREREGRFQTATELLDTLLDYLFNEKQRVTTQDMGRFMKSVFAKEIEEEVARQEDIDKAVAELAGVLTGETSSPSVGPSGPQRVPRTPAPPVVPAPPPPRSTPPAPVTPATTSPPVSSGPRAQTPVPPPGPPAEATGWTEKSRFRIRDGEGIVYGPMGFRTLVEIMNRDGLGAAEEISVDGAGWVAAGELPGLMEGLSDQRPARDPDFQGGFERRDFSRILYRYAVCKATGRMHLEAGSKRKEIFWRRGRPEYVTSNLRSELLGEYLVDRRLVSRARLNEALSALSDHGGRLGDALVHLNLLTPHDLFTALSSQVKAKLLEVFSWTSGRYAFYRGEHTTAQIVPLELGAYALINEGVCRRLALDELKSHFDNREQLGFFRCDHKVISPEDLQLSTKQLRIWNAVGHGPPIHEQLGRLLAIPGVDEADVYQVLFLMERLDFATLGHEVGRD
jgi:serine/threonine protein kinase